MKRLVIALAAFCLAAPATALAGGWATAGLAPPPEGIGAGDRWDARITILQHGMTPLEGVNPTLTIRSGSTVKTFRAAPTDKPGVYTAAVVFPTDGKWSYEVYDGFTQYGGAKTHTFGSVSVGPGGGGGLGFAALVVVGALLLAAVAVISLLLRRVRVRAPAPSH